MKKRTPLPCTPANCGDLYPKCGKKSTYNHGKCRCDSCHAAKAEKERQYYVKNREARNEHSRRDYAENREKYREDHKQYYEANREKSAERQKRRRKANPKKVAAQQRRSYFAHHEANKKRKEQYRLANPEFCRDIILRWKLANPERSREIDRISGHRRRAKIRATQIVKFTQEQLEQRMAYYGNACYLQIPGICTGGFDHIDHVKPLSKGGAHTLANFRPACAPCNLHKKGKWPFKFAA